MKALVFTITAKFEISLTDGIEGLEVVGEALEKLREQGEAIVSDVSISEDSKKKAA